MEIVLKTLTVRHTLLRATALVGIPMKVMHIFSRILIIIYIFSTIQSVMEIRRYHQILAIIPYLTNSRVEVVIVYLVLA